MNKINYRTTFDFGPTYVQIDLGIHCNRKKNKDIFTYILCSIGAHRWTSMISLKVNDSKEEQKDAKKQQKDEKNVNTSNDTVCIIMCMLDRIGLR